MATTTNYGWTTPDDTALVKDGAAAIRTLGSSVDTTTKALNPSTTLGDIEYRSSTANTNTRLGIGSSGQVLSVSGGVPAWVTSSSGGMTLLSTTTLSGAATTISSIDQTYTNLYVLITGVTNASSSSYFFLTPNAATTTAWNGILNSTIYSGVSVLHLTFGQDVTNNDANNAYALNIYNYSSTTSYKPVQWAAYFQNTGASRYLIAGGGFYSNSAITSLKFEQAGGNFSTGTVLVYGVK